MHIISNRDFTNGCLVAEILSWYYPQDVQLHSISNGASVQARLANWQLIDKARDLESVELQCLLYNYLCPWDILSFMFSFSK